MANFFFLYFGEFYIFLLSHLIKILLQIRGIKIGRNFRAESFPKINLDKNSKISIGDNFYLCQDVELRVKAGSIIEIHNECKMDRGVRLISVNKSRIKILDGSRLGCYSIVNGGHDITIGKKCLISGFVYLQSSSHGKCLNKFIRDQKHSYGEIIIENDVWIGAHSVILKGVKLKQGCIIGANSVVKSDCDMYKIYSGNPAKEVARRK